jgi:tetratricopeptide (TPR) repeat protein
MFMSGIDWGEILGWGAEEIEDLRFVAFTYIKQGLYDTAIPFFEALCLLSPSSAYDLQTLGALYLQKGNALEALRYLDKGLQLNPEHYPSLLNRSKALFLLGYNKQGTQQAEELQKCKDPDIAREASALLLSYTATP